MVSRVHHTRVRSLIPGLVRRIILANSDTQRDLIHNFSELIICQLGRDLTVDDRKLEINLVVDQPGPLDRELSPIPSGLEIGVRVRTSSGVAYVP